MSENLPRYHIYYSDAIDRVYYRWNQSEFRTFRRAIASIANRCEPLIVVKKEGN